MRISEVSKHTGLPISTIRFYERKGVTTTPHRNGRDRSYAPQDVRALEFIKDAQSLGLSLGEISSLLQGSWATGDMARTARTHRANIKDRIAALHRIDKVLAVLETCTCESFADCDLEAAQTGRKGCC